MRKRVLLLVLSGIFVLSLPDSVICSGKLAVDFFTLNILTRLSGQYPFLREQVQSCPGSTALFNVNRAVMLMDQYIHSLDRKEAALMMRMLLQPGYWTEKRKWRSRKITVDGQDGDWTGITGVADKRGDSVPGQPGRDIIHSRAFLDEEDNLRILIRTAGRPVRDQFFIANIDCTGDLHSDWQVYAFWWKGVLNVRARDLRPGGKVRKSYFPVGIGSVFEMSINLKKLVGLSRIKEQCRVQVFLKGMGRIKYLDSAPPVPVINLKENRALLLFLRLLDRRVFIKGDTITGALALANNCLYSIADRPARRAILQDMESHFALYKKILGRQKRMRVAYPLDRAPVIPKLYWADRCRNQIGLVFQAMRDRRERRLSLPVYREFVDRIEVLDRLCGILETKKLVRRGLYATAALIERYVQLNQMYVSAKEHMEEFFRNGYLKPPAYRAFRRMVRNGEFEKFHFGRKRQLHHFAWLNYQQALIGRTGKYCGNCGTATVMQMAFFRAAGIAPVSFQYVMPGQASGTHNFPGHYNHALRRWMSCQKPTLSLPGGVSIAERMSFFYFMKPYWHHWRIGRNRRVEKRKGIDYLYDPLFPGELVRRRLMRNFFLLGFGVDHFRRVFFSDRTQRPGFIFNDATAPNVVHDSDHDGLPDPVEKGLGTSPVNPDSDGDGASDSYELENGTDPLTGEKHPRPVIDGLGDDIRTLPGAVSLSDPAGDSSVKRNVFDIAGICAAAGRGRLFVAVRFHKRSGVYRQQELWIRPAGGSAPMFWVGHYPHGLIIVMRYRNKKWEKIRTGDDIVVRTGRDAEFSIPLSYFGNPSSLGVRYTVMSGPKGKEKRASDGTGELMVKSR